ncbi:hypothetical protein DQ04_01721060 [Trypanosoma grayi]|uniref:hypothetical protein n=1 Tax=Trypanosoma grayi TaxID=71804 RepID=UPI0004F416B4|nr:hypothetical protein DQ04_01721060 [Trypanosoma grayi]KEG12431.1 hypothetical protein DQ04_01721060 [Trypanosoma grayi]
MIRLLPLLTLHRYSVVVPNGILVENVKTAALCAAPALASLLPNPATNDLVDSPRRSGMQSLTMGAALPQIQNKKENKSGEQKPFPDVYGSSIGYLSALPHCAANEECPGFNNVCCSARRAGRCTK